MRFKDRDPKRASAPPIVWTLNFTAWVYTIEPWGQLERPPFPGTPKEERILPELMDGAGNLYTRLHAHQPNNAWAIAIARFAPGEKLGALYEITPKGPWSDPTVFSDPRKLIAADKDGNLYVELMGNILQFAPSGKLVRSLGPLGRGIPVKSVQDLDPRAPRQYPPNPPKSSLSAVSYFPYGESTSAIVDGAVYLLGYAAETAGRDKQKVLLMRLTLDGKLAVLATVSGPGTKYEGGWTLAASPDGNLHFPVQASGKTVLLTYSKQGAFVRETSSFPSGLERLKGIDSEGAFYGDYCSRVSNDFSLKGMRLEDLRYRYRERKSINEPQVEIDLLTNAEPPKDSKGTPSCWVDRDAVYVLHPDRQVAKFTLQGATPTLAQASVAPAASAGLLLRRLGGDFGTGVALDGQTPVDFEAVLTDPKGVPIAGAPVELIVVDQDLPRRGQLRYLGPRQTDAQGRVRGRYLPPKIEARELDPRRGLLILGFQATATPHGLPAADANENVRGLPLVPAFFRISRAGYATVDQIPAQIVMAQGGILAGSVVHRAARRVTLGAGMTEEIREYPVAAATVELLADARTILGKVTSGSDGSFRLEFGAQDAPAARAEIALPEPLRFERLEPEVADHVLRFRQALRSLADAQYGYEVQALTTLLDERFPERLAAANDEVSILKELDALERVGLLSTALLVSHRLVEYGSGRFVESIEAFVQGLIDLFDPMQWEKAGPDVRTAVFKLYEKTPLKRDLIRNSLGKLWLRLMTEQGYHAGSATGQAFWAPVKDYLTNLLLGGVEFSGWKPGVLEMCVGDYRKQAQAELDRAARAWESRTLPFGGRVGPIFRARDADLESRLRQAADRQMNLDSFKAGVKLGFDTLGNSVKIVASLYASPAGGEAARKGVDGLERGFKVFQSALDTGMMFDWAGDIVTGYEAARQFGQAALSAAPSCFGGGC